VIFSDHGPFTTRQAAFAVLARLLEQQNLRIPLPAFPASCSLALEPCVTKRCLAAFVPERERLRWPGFGADGGVLAKSPMTLDDLSQPEQVVLLALVGLMARMDGSVSEDEMELLEQIADEIGEKRFEAARDAAAALADGSAILGAAASVKRPEAREIIFELVYGIAVRDTIAESEAALLNELAALWDLPQRVGESG